VPVPTEVAAAVMEGQAATSTTAHSTPVESTRSTDVDSGHSAGPTEAAQSTDVACSEPATDVACSEPADVAASETAASETASVPSTESPAAPVAAAPVAAASATASARVCRGCNGTRGERAGEQNDHRLLQHFPISLFLAAACGTCDQHKVVCSRAGGFSVLPRFARGCRDLKGAEESPAGAHRRPGERRAKALSAERCSAASRGEIEAKFNSEQQVQRSHFRTAKLVSAAALLRSPSPVSAKLPPFADEATTVLLKGGCP
jgi:hypothetical protein